jgi:hypothetical protein
MPTVQPELTGGSDRPLRSSAERGGEARPGALGRIFAGERRWAWSGLAVVLALGLALRLWGVRQGLPYAYNIDEHDHFVPHAVEMFARGTLNPHYFANPPAFSYLLHYLFALSYGGGAGVVRAFELHPAGLYTLARIAAAILGTSALWLLYATGARLFGRAVGLLAATIEAVAFLPVFYAHLALNDVPTLAPLTLSLLGTAGVLRKGRARDYLLAGAGLGLACASKYTAGIAIAPLVAAIAMRYLARDSSPAEPLVGSAGPVSDRCSAGAPPVARGLALAAAAALVAFLIANPYAVLDYRSFHGELVHQSTLSSEAQGKLGAPHHGGLLYYLWSLTWGLGWVPALAALGGALTVWRSDRRLGWLLLPAPLLFLAFMGLQGRYFGRWLLPIFPILCLLAAFFALRSASALAEILVRHAPRVFARRASRSPTLRLHGALIAIFVLALCAQGLIYSVHSGLVLARADTRNLTRAWMVAHVPVGAKIVVEPIAPNDWALENVTGPVIVPRIANRYRWYKYPSLVSVIAPDGTVDPSARKLVSIEDYERTVSPALVTRYEQKGYCWVVSGSTQSGRVLPEGMPLAPGVGRHAGQTGTHTLPLAVAYYRALAVQAQVVYHASPYAPGSGPVAFNFDWTFDYYPLTYRRPGPEVTIYRLHGGRCGA